ncbi:MAG: hypothetical protein ACJATN_000428 [Neolewinella sp.]|jgi:hypothetical protein
MQQLLQEFNPGLTVSPTDSFKSDVVNPPSTLINLDHYYQVNGQDAILPGLKHQSSLSISQQAKLFGTGFSLGGSIYFNEDNLDRGRSGFFIQYDRKASLYRIQQNTPSSFLQEQNDRLQKLKELDPRVKGAAQVLLFEEYLSTLNSNAYQEVFLQLNAARDTSLTYVMEEWNTADSLLFSRKSKVEEFNAEYQVLLQQVSGLPASVRHKARHIIDSCQTVLGQSQEAYFRKRLLRAPGTGLLKKLLLLSSGFSVGNTRLGDNDIASAGLPIRGVSYAYAHNGVAFEFQHGKRLLSDRFTPQDGFVYHDQQRGMRFSQIAFSWQPDPKSNYSVVGLEGREAPENGQGVNASFPRTNRVLGLSGKTRITNAFSLLTDAFYSTTLLNGRTVGDASSVEKNPINQTALNLGGTLRWKSLDLELGLFHRGADFVSFANPYLFSDYRGIQSRVRLNGWAGRLTGDFQFSVGQGTLTETKDNVRIQARGYARMGLTKSTFLSLMAAPNVYRYEISGKEGFSESTIYRADLQHNGKIGAKRFSANFSLTNLDQGWAWSDTTQVTSAVILRGNGRLEITKTSSVTADGQRALSPNPDNEEWYCSLGFSNESKLRFSATFRYDKYRFETIPAPGGSIELFVPFGHSLNARFNIYFRATSGQVNDTTVPDFFSHQSWESRF